MRTGKLRDRVVFQRPEDVSDGAGGFAREWITVYSRRANRQVKGGRFFHSLMQRYSQMSEAFTLRKLEIEPEWRLVYNDEPHRIVAVEEYRRSVVVVTEKEQRTKNSGY